MNQWKENLEKIKFHETEIERLHIENKTLSKNVVEELRAQLDFVFIIVRKVDKKLLSNTCFLTKTLAEDALKKILFVRNDWYVRREFVEYIEDDVLINFVDK
ncbi:MAG: hypothetical protein K2Q45_06755 [Nitrosomonas sp.]|nr:hypothetical protein [Nitrosomonas sp.]